MLIVFHHLQCFKQGLTNILETRKRGCFVYSLKLWATLPFSMIWVLFVDSAAPGNPISLTANCSKRRPGSIRTCELRRAHKDFPICPEGNGSHSQTANQQAPYIVLLFTNDPILPIMGVALRYSGQHFILETC